MRLKRRKKTEASSGKGYNQQENGNKLKELILLENIDRQKKKEMCPQQSYLKKK